MHGPVADERADPRRREQRDAPVITGPGLMEGAGSLLRELKDVAHDYVVLAALETKRAGLSLVIMLAASVMMAILLVSAWLGLVAAGVFGLMAAGLAPGFALLIAVLANLLLAVGLYLVIRYKRHDLAFPATVRNLRPSGTADQPGSIH